MNHFPVEENEDSTTSSGDHRDVTLLQMGSGSSSNAKEIPRVILKRSSDVQPKLWIGYGMAG
jgi:hypothetical protein